METEEKERERVSRTPLPPHHPRLPHKSLSVLRNQNLKCNSTPHSSAVPVHTHHSLTKWEQMKMYLWSLTGLTRAVWNSKGKRAAHRNSRSKEQIKLRFQHTTMRVFLQQKSIAFCASCVCESAWGRRFFLDFLSWPLLCTGPMLAVLSLECRPPDCMCFFTAYANSSEMLDFQVLHLCQQFFSFLSAGPADAWPATLPLTLSWGIRDCNL